MSFETLNLFEQMQPREVQWLLAAADVMPVEAGEVILREGEPPANIFFVADGQLEVSAYSGEGKITKVGRLQPGDVMGEISWLDRQPASGSIMAIEPGIVLRLSMTALDDKIRTDPLFGSNFLRGVAVLLAQRLRRTTIQLRGLAGSPAGEDGAITSCLAEIKKAVAQLDKESGSADAVALLKASLHALEREVHDKNLAPGSAEAIRQELRPIISRSAVGLRCVTKPRGYAGDFATQEMIYVSQPAGVDATGRIIEEALFDLAGFRAIRGRFHLMAEALRQEATSRSGPLAVTSLGAGAAPEILNLIGDKALAPRLTVTCIEVDREAVTFLERKVEESGSSAHVAVSHANLLHLATGHDELGLEPQHVIASSRFFDVIGDDAAVTLMNWSHRALLPGGTMIIGSIGPEDPSGTLLSEALDWRITHRTQADIDRLLQRSLFKGSAARFVADASHPGYLAVVTKAP